MLFIGLTLMGYFSYRFLPMELYPNAELPELTVNIGASTELDPKYIENQAVIPVEGVISTMEGVEKDRNPYISPQCGNKSYFFERDGYKICLSETGRKD